MPTSCSGGSAATGRHGRHGSAAVRGRSFAGRTARAANANGFRTGSRGAGAGRQPPAQPRRLRLDVVGEGLCRRTRRARFAAQAAAGRMPTDSPARHLPARPTSTDATPTYPLRVKVMRSMATWPPDRAARAGDAGSCGRRRAAIRSSTTALEPSTARGVIVASRALARPGGRGFPGPLPAAAARRRPRRALTTPTAPVASRPSAKLAMLTP